MEFPGEKLALAMWASLIDKGIGNLLKPSQIRREGRAQADVRSEELLRIAQAERDAEDIRNGRKSLCLSGDTPRLISNAPTVEPTLPKLTVSEPSFSLEPLPATIENAHYSDLLRREVNISKAIQHAEDDLLKSVDPVPENSPEGDWLYRWRDYAGEVSSEEMQGMWGRLLAGEIKSPGKHSLRTLDFLRNASMAEAHLVAKVAPFIFSGLIYKDNDLLTQYGISFGNLLRLEELGLLSGVGGMIGTQRTSEASDRYLSDLRAAGWVLRIEGPDQKHILTFDAFRLTKVGAEVFELGDVVANASYLRDVGRKLKGGNLTVALLKLGEQIAGTNNYPIVEQEIL